MKRLLAAFGLLLTFTLPNAAFAAVAFQSAGTSPGASSQTCVITKPAGTSVGDLLIASCSFDDGGASTVSLGGWTVLKKTQTGTYTLATLYKIADAGDAAAANFTFTTTGTSGSNVGGMIRLSGTAASSIFDTPQDATASATGVANNASSNTITSTGDMLIGIGGSRDDDNWSSYDVLNSSGGSSATGYTKTEQVDVNTISGNDTSLSIDTIAWDGSGTGTVFGSANRAGSVSVMAGQLFVVHAPAVAAALTEINGLVQVSSWF